MLDEEKMKLISHEEKSFASVFLSHSSEDKVFAKEIAWELKKKGIKVWLDEAEIKIGDSLIEKISEGIENFDYLAVVLSPASVNSRWVRKELEIAINEEISSGKAKTLPILYEECNIPPFLKGKLYADFSTNADFNESLNRLIMRLEKERSVFFPDDHPIFTTKSNLINYVFQGKPLNKGYLIVIGSRPSIGKSALAIDVSVSLLRAQSSVFYLNLKLSETQILARFISSVSGISLDKIRFHQISDEENKAIGEAKGFLQNSNLAIATGPKYFRLSDFREDLDNWFKLHDKGLIVVDYLQLLESEESTKHLSFEEQKESINASIEEISSIYQQPILVLVNLNKEIDERKTPEPFLPDLREISLIEQFGSHIILLWKESEKAFVKSVVNRFGPLSRMELNIDMSNLRILCKNNIQQDTGGDA